MKAFRASLSLIALGLAGALTLAACGKKEETRLRRRRRRRAAR